MDLKEKRSYLQILRLHYHKADKKGKSLIINELVKNLSYHRKYAISLLRSNQKYDLRTKIVKHRTRPSPYASIVVPLKELWLASNYCCPERLHPFIPELLRVLEEKGEVKVNPEQRQLLSVVSRATVGRLLSPLKKQLHGKGKATTKPGTLLKHQIPIQTFANWNSTQPGFLEIDLVAMCGETLFGDYINILDTIDSHLCWSEIQGFMGKSQHSVTQALETIQQRLPFKINGLDSDNDAPFINFHLVAFCEANQITFTRSRPYRKNDQAHVEQKNYSVVRKYLGYQRLDNFPQLTVVNQVCQLLSLYHNFFQPVLKLKEKVRIGSKIRRKYDQAQTPFQRLLDSEHVSHKTKQFLKKKYQTLNPKALIRQIISLINQL